MASQQIPDHPPIASELLDEHLPPQRGWWQFSLRTLLFLVIIASMGAAWWADRQRLLGRLEVAEQELAYYTKINNAWGSEQATGPPDTPGAGDISTAWASADPDNQREWLQLKYSRAVRPTAVLIHETYNPGAVYKVGVIDADGQEHIVWQGKDPTPTTAARGVSRIPININYQVDRVKIYIDSPAVPGWNEIDAVGLVEPDGNTLWARFCTASSTYGTTSSMSTVQPVPMNPGKAVGPGMPVPAVNATWQDLRELKD